MPLTIRIAAIDLTNFDSKRREDDDPTLESGLVTFSIGDASAPFQIKVPFIKQKSIEAGIFDAIRTLESVATEFSQVAQSLLAERQKVPR